MNNYLPIDMDKLLEDGHIPADSEVISTHNNLVVVSINESTVSRIGRLSTIAKREDPGDIAYSHRLAWTASDVAPIVRPVSAEPIQSNDIIISSFPLREKVDLNNQNPLSIHNVLGDFGKALDYVSGKVALRHFDIAEYAQQRLDRANYQGFNDAQVLDHVQQTLSAHQETYPFDELTEDDPTLVHGDLHTGNIVGNQGSLEIIDLDSAARGPKLYDLASWRVRQEMGDNAPIDSVVGISCELSTWDDESYRALIGWKIISSMTHVIKNEKINNIRDRINMLERCAYNLDAFIYRKADGQCRDLVSQ